METYHISGTPVGSGQIEIYYLINSSSEVD